MDLAGIEERKGNNAEAGIQFQQASTALKNFENLGGNLSKWDRDTLRELAEKSERFQR